ncbi:odorant receptor Or2-like [Venturia canescens]|uniref:odorant receptor Or2-like n=1 Tax=Venturia canescens TaxID=32260 RepID=UPI001C9D0125|nr:odorant receptor Or2-like [Venturia canescens]
MKRRNFNDYSYFNKFLLNASGLLPIKSKNNVLTLFLAFATFGSSCFLFVPGFYSLIFHWNNINPSDRFDVLLNGSAFIVCAIKVLVLFPKREKLLYVTENCANLWKYVESDKDIAIIDKFGKRGLYVTYMLTVNISIGTFFYLITPFFTDFVLDANGTVLESKALPISAGVFHDDVKKFHIWHALQVPTTCDSVIAIIALDTAIPFYVLQACAHMQLCQNVFERIADSIRLDETLTDGEDDWNTKRTKFCQLVVKGVVYHSEILQYTKDVEDIFQTVILAQILASLAAICGYCFGILVGDETERPKIMTCLLSVTAELLLICWPPDILQTEGLKVGDAAYNLPWYDWTREEGKLICMIIAKSQRPVIITARKMAIMSLETFTWVMKSAFSLLTLLRQILE